MLTAALALLVTLQGSAGDMRLLRHPDIHGDKVVFTYAGDLWLWDRHGGPARRLTDAPGGDSYAKFSPDGKSIAFTGNYDGNAGAYVMPAEGGEPKRLTFHAQGDQVAGWTPDGKVAFISSYGAPNLPLGRVWLVKPTGGPLIPTQVLEASNLSFSPDGLKIAYNRMGSHTFNWRRYRGGTQGVISIWDIATGSYSELPHEREQSWEPMWVGDRIYYIGDKTLGTVNLYSYDTKTKQIQQLTKFSDADIRWPSTDGKNIVFEKAGCLMTYEIATGKLATLSPEVLSDKAATRPELRQLGMQIRGLTISPSGKRVAVEARGRLFSLPAKNGDTRSLVDVSGARATSPAWSPDGKTLAYLSDASGEVKIYTVPQMGGTPKMIDTDPTQRIDSFRWSPDGKMISYTTFANEMYILDLATGKAVEVFQNKLGGAQNYDWSPDCKWIAFINTGDNLFGATFLYEIATKKTTKVTEGYFRDDAVSFDLNGKYLYLVSARTFNPQSGDFELDMGMKDAQRVYVVPLAKDAPNPLNAPVDEEPAGKAEHPAKDEPSAGKIDLDGLASRALPLPLPAGNYDAIVGADGGVLIFTQGKLESFDLAGKAAQDIVENIQSVDFTPKRDKMAFLSGPMLCVSDVHPGVEPAASRVNTSEMQAIVDPRAEWKQIFWEAWRYERDHFYDPQMLGLDWRAIGESYEKLLPYVADRGDLNYILGMLIGELGTSHAYVGGGESSRSQRFVPVGCLGADYDTYAGHVRFKKIYRGFNYDEESRGPLGDPGVNVKEGEFLLAVDGKPVDENVCPDELLVGKAGRFVTLTVNSTPSMTGAREVRVKTLADESNLRYTTWVEENRRKVAELSGGRIGYMHVPNTSEGGIVGMVKGYYSQSDKEAMIVDERYNGGGNIPTFLIEMLGRRLMAGMRSRYGSDVTFPTQILHGPMAMLINGYAGSGGDLFPWFFREAKLGPLIGKRTWGGLVGIAGVNTFVDGGFLTSPAFGLYDLKTGHWIAENRGIDPDIDVDARPDLVAKGQDPQLEAAVKYLLGELAKGKPEIKAPEGYPRVKTPAAKPF
jgi:tricorn protease